MRPDPRTDRLFAATLLALLPAIVALHLLGAGPLRDAFWGVHAYAFLPRAWLPIALALLAGACALVRLARNAAHPAVPAALRGARWQAAALPLATLGGFTVCWLARARHIILGDASTQVVSIAGGERFHLRQPLAALLQHLFYRAGGGLFGAGTRPGPDIAWDTTALGSAIAGGLFVPVAWGLARELAALRRPADGEGPADGALAPLLCLLLCTQGYAQLFCGYVENYTWYTLALGGWLWLSLRALRTGAGLLAATLALAAAVLLHLSGAVVAPAFAVVALGALRRGATRRAAARDLLLAGVAVTAALWAISRLGHGYDLFATLASVGRAALSGEDGAPPGYLLSAAHWRDFTNEQLLIGPLGLPLLVVASVAVVMAGGARRAPSLFLLSAAGAYLAASWLAGPSNLGYPRNWDLLAPGGLVLLTAGLGLFLIAGVSARRAWPPLACAVALSLFHTAPWIAVNASFDRGFARLKSLPSEGGITQTNVGRWYYLRGERAEARTWLERAVAINAGNNNAHWLLGKLAMDAGDYDAAVRDFGRAVALRPDKEGYRESLVEALLSTERWADAVRAARPLLDMSPSRARVWALYGMALLAAGQAQPAAEACARFRALAPSDTTSAHVIGRLHVRLANAACAARRLEAAAAGYREALRWDGGNVAACLNLGLVLSGLGRTAEARPWLEQALRLDPRLPEGDRVRALLRDSGDRQADRP